MNTKQTQNTADKPATVRTEIAPVGRTEALQTGRVIAPPVDIYENDQTLLLVTDLPGVKRDDIRLHLDGERLIVEARRTEGLETPVTYRRTFAVAPIFNADQVSAQLDRGVLRVTLPKADAVKPRAIAIQTA